jgi:hypothetical protein
MDVCEPHVRRRGFFLHSDTAGESDHAEMDNPEGVVIRVRMGRRAARRQMSGGRSHRDSRSEESRPEIRSGSVTGSRQRAHLPR